MTDDKFNRRDFIAAGTTVALGSLLSAQDANAAAQLSKDTHTFSRYRPSFGGAPGNDDYLGKLVPGLRPSGQSPVLMHAPDLNKLA